MVNLEDQRTCPECGHDELDCLLCLDDGCGNCDCGCECDYVPDSFEHGENRGGEEIGR